MGAIKRAIEPYQRQKEKERQKEHDNTTPGKNKEENTSSKLPEVNSGETKDIIKKFESYLKGLVLVFSLFVPYSQLSCE
jgi:hypothetical protein